MATLLTHALQYNIIGINQKLFFLLADNDIILLLYDSFSFHMPGEWKNSCVYMPGELTLEPWASKTARH